MAHNSSKTPILAAISLIFALFAFAVFSTPSVQAAGFEVSVVPVKDAITETQPAVFSFILTNNDANVYYELFSLNTDFTFLEETLFIPSGRSITKEIQIFPKTTKSGVYDVTIFVRNQQTRDAREIPVRIRLVTLRDSLAMFVEPSVLRVSDDELTFVVKNRADNNLENLKLETSSPIFSKDFEFSIVAKEEQRFTIPIDLKNAEGGEHSISVKGYQNGVLTFERDVPYNLEEIYDFDQSRSITGFLVREKKLTYDNAGNTREEVDIEEDMNFLEKVFSYFSDEPTFRTEAGALKATWNLEIEPYTKEEVIVKTNYLLPLIMLILIVGGFALTVRYQGKGIIVTKTAARAKSNRGSAFKVTIRVKNRKDAIREVKIRDNIPSISGAKVHEKFDFVKPAKIGENFVEWHLPLLQGGEERVFTYHIVSESEVPGIVQFPSTHVNYLTLHREPRAEYSGPAKIDAAQKITMQAASAVHPGVQAGAIGATGHSGTSTGTRQGGIGSGSGSSAGGHSFRK